MCYRRHGNNTTSDKRSSMKQKLLWRYALVKNITWSLIARWSYPTITTNSIVKDKTQVSDLHPKYRPDIDGLRAVAVLLVVMYHAFPGKFHGGFIGVDIFFVISGFLISSIIFSNLEGGSFSIAGFYNRRIRRIFPALLFVMGCSLAFGWTTLFADEYTQLAKHVAGGAAFVSNILLYRESGYFDNTSDTKPMLHLWSLAIEEQFYIFWPLLLAFVWKRKWSFLRITAVIALLSFVANIYLTQKSPDAAFYWPISRFWELMIGGLLAYAALHKPALIRRGKDLQSTIGFILLFAGAALINDK
jgi:peptidoglycan/LPS O-acetylase OafA/YrhL